MRIANRYLAGSAAWFVTFGLLLSSRGAEELLADPELARGFEVLAPAPHGSMPVVQGTLQTDEEHITPAWRLAQWSSRTTLANSSPQRAGDGLVRFVTETKSLILYPPKHKQRMVALLVRGDREYQSRLRAPEEPWPHLLVEQTLNRQPSLKELAALRFRIAYQLLRVQTNTTQRLAPWHCAQFEAVILVKNLNPSSAGYGDYLWFAIPLYDSRYQIPPEFAAQDTAGSHKFIYAAPGKSFSQIPAGSGNWINVDQNVLPLIREGLNRAWEKNFMSTSRDLSDLHPFAFSIGWEVTGPLEVEMRFRGVSLQATEVATRDTMR
jgi:hypothetical protein